MFAPPSQLPVMKPPEMKPPTNSFLAPPPGATQSGLSMPVLGYSSPSPMGPNSSNPPQPDTRPSPAPPAASAAASAPTPPQPQAAQKSSALKAPTPHAPPPTKTPSSSKHVPSHTGRSKGHAQKEKASPPPRPPTPPPNGKATRNCILLQNFNENAISQKAVQTRILFGKEMQKLAKPGPAPRCVITNHLARYRDPETGLPYYNSHAYKQIQKLKHGDYKWSQLAGSSNHPAPPALVTEKIIPVAEHSATKDANPEVVSVSSSANAPVGPGLVHSVTSPVGAATSDASKISPTSTPVPVSISALETTQEGEAFSSKSALQVTDAVQP
ncbi:uncharacterized protein PG986_007476 [Apiospora aurea]|uniref:Vps72/YL1 C-terminal domain-containing protein n=1 Tax=Apiospora aurea TaxID=335848 RepID=A0ABR1QCP3_9PEZI